MHSSAYPSKQKGAALLMVLVVVASALALVTTLMNDTHRDIREARQARDALTLHYAALAAEAYVFAVTLDPLERDDTDFAGNMQAVFDVDDFRAVTNLPDDIRLKVHQRDLQASFNLAHLGTEDLDMRNRQRRIFHDYCTSMTLSAAACDDIYASVVDTLGDDDIAPNPYELDALAIKSVRPSSMLDTEQAPAFRRAFTSLPAAVPLNLASINERFYEIVTGSRRVSRAERGTITSIGTEASPFQELGLPTGGQSTYFALEIQASVEKHSIGIESLYRRNLASKKAYKILRKPLEIATGSTQQPISRFN